MGISASSGQHCAIGREVYSVEVIIGIVVSGVKTFPGGCMPVLQGTIGLGSHHHVHSLQLGRLGAPSYACYGHLVIHSKLGASQSVRKLSCLHVIDAHCTITIP